MSRVFTDTLAAPLLHTPLVAVRILTLAAHAAGQTVDPVAVGAHRHRRGLLKKIGSSHAAVRSARARRMAAFWIVEAVSRAWAR